MPNARRGEMSASFNGKDYTLCLTLGALAELEDAFGVGDLTALGERFTSGKLSAKDIMLILKAGLKGGGQTLSADDIHALQHDEGLSGSLRTVAQLLSLTFGASETPSLVKDTSLSR